MFVSIFSEEETGITKLSKSADFSHHTKAN